MSRHPIKNDGDEWDFPEPADCDIDESAAASFRPCKKLWTTRDGTKIRICDMGDSHIINTIHMLQRNHTRLVCEAYRAYVGLQGEMAIDSLDREIAHMETEGPDATQPLYTELCVEADRRGLKYDD